LKTAGTSFCPGSRAHIFFGVRACFPGIYKSTDGGIKSS
jgi:hypothetical protein